MEYKEYELGELIEYRNEKLLIENVSLENYISTENLLPNRNGKQNAEKLPNTKSVKKYYENDILISNIRPYFKKIWQAEIPGGASNDVLILNSCSNNTTNDYLYYYLSQDKFFDYMTQTAKGTKMPRGDKKAILGYEIKVPNIKHIQNYIVNLGKNIDKKIETNKKIIANLEELSQTIFKHWFVDFEFPDENGNPYKSSGGEMVDSELGMIPKGWEIITINDFANNNVITGKTPSTKIKENYSETGIPFLTIPDMHNDIFALNTERYISELGIEKLIKKVLPKNSLSISCIATPGLVCIIANDTLTNQQINSFTPNKNALYYLYFKLKSMKDYIRDLGSGGSATLNLNKTQFSKIKLVKPINEILYKYDKLVSPNFKMILNIQKEIQQLTQLRDTLLPKLMSGEIEIPDDIEVMEDELSI
ncbi:restriction endonuclease subunit S [Staphylococcus delphini]|uniref:restriction endonuclease subunit S n=1 Tax=Staphylococcus delphini TaxID=53344 RepID=UPI0021D057DB|nr:restriction endonuclease subunit S [Staphylococcus delphini]UXS29337.1 restriction endonuclease subunit S [Staphylococcus delphini]